MIEDAMLRMILRRSEELQEVLIRKLTDVEFDDSPRGKAVHAMCAATFEHATGLRVLVESDCVTSATAMLRLQYESLTRAMWLLYVAPDSSVERLSAPLTSESEKLAKGLPSQGEMLEQIRKAVGTNVPASAAQMLDRFRSVSWQSLNSYVHAGIHVLGRQADGYPTQLVVALLRNSNGLSTMAAMTLAVLTNRATARSMARIQPDFADCLPELLTTRAENSGQA